MRSGNNFLNSINVSWKMAEEIKDYIDCLDDDLIREVKMIYHALNTDRSKAQTEGVKHNHIKLLSYDQWFLCL